jgi:hypothetical protein
MTGSARWLDRIGVGLGAAALLALAPVSWPPALHAVWLVIALAIAPGWLASPLLAPGGGTVHRGLLAITLSPFLTGMPAAWLVWSGLPVTVAARLVLGGVAVLALVRAMRPAPLGEDGEEATTWAAALGWAAIVAALLTTNRWLAPRADGWFHAAVTLQILEQGLPPEDPFFAGLRLLYFWGYHLWAALWLALAPAMAVWTPMVALNVTGAIGAVLGACLIARRLGARRRGVGMTALLTVFGYAPFSWLLFLMRAFAGQDRGLDEARRLLDRGLGPIVIALNPETLHTSMVFFGDKFFILTPLGLGLAVFAALLVAFIDFAARPDLRKAAALMLLQCSALFIHSVVGWATALVAGAWWWWALWRSRRREEMALRGALLPLLGVFLGAALLMLPYLAATTLGKQQGLRWGMSSWAVAAWLAGGGLLVPPGVAWLARHARRTGAARELLGVGVILSAAGLFLGLPGNNQVKFFNLLFLAMAPPAALAWIGLQDRLAPRWRGLVPALLVLAMAPTTALCLFGLVTESGQTARFWQRPSTQWEHRGLAWAREHTLRDAVFIDRTLTLDMTVHAARSTLWGGTDWAGNWGYPPAALTLRRQGVAELGRGDPPAPAVRAFLDGLGREVIVMARRLPSRDADSLFRPVPPRPFPWRNLPPGFRLLYQNPDVALYRWESGTSSASPSAIEPRRPRRPASPG